MAATLAPDLLRTVTRAFYPTTHVLVIETLLHHSTLPDTDLASVLALQPKALRPALGRLKEDGLLSAVTRGEKRTDGSGTFMPAGAGSSNINVQTGDGKGMKERVVNKEWYYLNYHRAIDCIKYRLHRLNTHFGSLGAPTTEKKDLSCAQCGSQWTELEVMHNIDFTTGAFLCARCDHPLDPVPEEDRVQENESVKRLNSQLEKILALMQRIDAASVPENDWDAALANHRPVVRTHLNPAQRTETVELPGNNLLSSRGLATVPEKIAVSLHSEEEVRLAAAAEEKIRREKEAGQNALPDWIARSTVSGDPTVGGAREAARRLEREGLAAGNGEVKVEEKKAEAGNVDLDAYFDELKKAQAEQQAREDAEEEEEEDDEEDEGDFADVDLSAPTASALGVNGTVGLVNGSTKATLMANGVANGNANSNGKRPAPPPSSTGASTPALTSSNATDDEREAKRPRIQVTAADGSAALSGLANGVHTTNGSPSESTNGVAKVQEPDGIAAQGTPAASDEDEDDELEFENV
ncbi:hypothetical protein LTR53_008054 [Teratosphaeriaceae sp. CCFEE 6253]|nr:hypothetical protein LTR53_008054 [Teratosphaeriaceae sp. CCFEE 6253]